jgi:hypothetical protein
VFALLYPPDSSSDFVHPNGFVDCVVPADENFDVRDLRP